MADRGVAQAEEDVRPDDRHSDSRWRDHSSARAGPVLARAVRRSARMRFAARLTEATRAHRAELDRNLATWQRRRSSRRYAFDLEAVVLLPDRATLACVSRRHATASDRRRRRSTELVDVRASGAPIGVESSRLNRRSSRLVCDLGLIECERSVPTRATSDLPRDRLGRGREGRADRRSLKHGRRSRSSSLLIASSARDIDAVTRRIRELRKGNRLNGLTIRELIDEGRR